MLVLITSRIDLLCQRRRTWILISPPRLEPTSSSTQCCSWSSKFLHLDVYYQLVSTATREKNSFTHTFISFDRSFIRALEEETRDISTRFQSERRPQPAGLDRALGDDRTNSRSGGRGTNENHAQHKYASKSGGFVTGMSTSHY